ncbi:energy transducer TonB (plasmid) [Roseomonas mucosa]|uniref:energy transducer TonB n=1 Tax=Roseomonas mucosa TaxID=207340 RepID=UPI0030D529E1
MSWNEGVGAWCVRFLVSNPYSGRPEQRAFGVLPTGEVGPGEAACSPPRPPRPARPAASDGQDFVRLIGADLQARMRYPGAAREAREEGVARIAVTVHRDGHVTDMLIESSSGVPSLDVAALELVGDLTVPVFPADVAGDRMPLVIPVRYALLSAPPPAPPAPPPAAPARRGVPAR